MNDVSYPIVYMVGQMWKLCVCFRAGSIWDNRERKGEKNLPYTKSVPPENIITAKPSVPNHRLLC